MKKSYTLDYSLEIQKLSVGSKKLPTLACGVMVAIQDQYNYAKPALWTKTGLVLEVLDHDSSLVKVDGSGRTTQRNRRCHMPVLSVISLSPLLSLWSPGQGTVASSWPCPAPTPSRSSIPTITGVRHEEATISMAAGGGGWSLEMKLKLYLYYCN